MCSFNAAAVKNTHTCTCNVAFQGTASNCVLCLSCCLPESVLPCVYIPSMSWTRPPPPAPLPLYIAPSPPLQALPSTLSTLLFPNGNIWLLPPPARRHTVVYIALIVACLPHWLLIVIISLPNDRMMSNHIDSLFSRYTLKSPYTPDLI